jgi:hypothetical protein
MTPPVDELAVCPGPECSRKGIRNVRIVSYRGQFNAVRKFVIAAFLDICSKTIFSLTQICSSMRVTAYAGRKG